MAKIMVSGCLEQIDFLLGKQAFFFEDMRKLADWQRGKKNAGYIYTSCAIFCLPIRGICQHLCYLVRFNCKIQAFCKGSREGGKSRCIYLFSRQAQFLCAFLI